MKASNTRTIDPPAEKWREYKICLHSDEGLITFQLPGSEQLVRNGSRVCPGRREGHHERGQFYPAKPWSQSCKVSLPSTTKGSYIVLTIMQCKDIQLGTV